MNSRNTKALQLIAVALAALTYCGAVIYGDIMFIQVMHSAFPSGVMGTLALAGAVMTAMSAITLPIALHYWFAPGLQFMWGVIFWAVDIVALSLNAMLAYQVATGGADTSLAMWQTVSPATPMLAVIGWGIAFLLDPSHKLRHAQAELEADLIDIHAAQLRDAAQHQHAAITANAQRTAAETARALTGHATPPALPAPTYSPNGNGKHAYPAHHAPAPKARASKSTSEDADDSTPAPAGRKAR